MFLADPNFLQGVHSNIELSWLQSAQFYTKVDSLIFWEVQKFNCLYKNFFACTKTKFDEWKSSFGVVQNFWTGSKCISTFTFGLAQKNLGPVEGRGIRVSFEFVAFILLPMFEGHLVVVNHQLYYPSQTMMNKSYDVFAKRHQFSEHFRCHRIP